MIIRHNRIYRSRARMLVASVFLIAGSIYGALNIHHAAADTFEWISPDITAAKEAGRSTNVNGLYKNHVQQCAPQTIGVGNSTNFDTPCVYQAKSYRLAHVYRCTPNWWGSCDREDWMAIGFNSDSRMYKVQNLYWGSGDYCWQTTSVSDVVVFQCNGTLEIIDDLPHHLTRTTGSTGTEYQFDSTATHGFIDTSGRGVQINAATMSQNGEWVAAEAEGVGLMRVDLSDNSVRMFTEGAGQYGYGRDPSYEFSITNDGQYVAVGGLNVGSSIYRINDSCGDQAQIFKAEWRQSNQNFNTCPMKDTSSILANTNGGSAAGFRAAEFLSFSDDGGQLDMLESPYNAVNGASQAWIKLTAANYTSANYLDYLALGDSYSSGEGDAADGGSHYLWDGNSCHLSSRSYPFLLRDYWKIVPASMKSVACSGAKVLPDYIGNGNYYGQHNQIDRWDASRIADTQPTALNNFTPGVMRQIEFVKRYKPERITFTGGGNDVGFAPILEYCANSYRLFNVLPTNETCAFAADPQMRANLNKSIDDQYNINKLLVEKIREASPATKMYMIGYPQFIAVEGWSCANNSDILNKTERQMIHDSVSRLNNVLKKVARDTGVYYIDIEDSLEGGQICQGSEYMTGPLKMIVSNYSVKKDNNMFHPNANGHEKIAEAIERELSAGLNYTILDIPDEQNGMRTIRTAVMPDYSGVGSTHTITMDPGMFMPNGEVTIELFSQPINLGITHTTSEGALRTDITFPKNIEGDHLLTITGLDTNGERVQLQQFITITSGIPNDIDGDGILDKDDACNFITHWYSAGKDICLPQSESSEKSIDNIAQIKSGIERLFSNSQDGVGAVGSLNDQGVQNPSPKQSVIPSDNAFSRPRLILVGFIAIISIVMSATYVIKKRNTNV